MSMYGEMLSCNTELTRVFSLMWPMTDNQVLRKILSHQPSSAGPVKSSGEESSTTALAAAGGGGGGADLLELAVGGLRHQVRHLRVRLCV